jgi:leader peptidase (prepilin peptidase)/N-methyltransferase
MSMTLIELIQQRPAELIALTGLLGLLAGSFLNVVIYRLPLMMEREWRHQCCEFLELEEQDLRKAGPLETQLKFTLSTPDSHCPHCKAAVRAWQNIPVLSYLMLGGRCASCKATISSRYPLVEVATGLLSAAVAWQFGATALTLALLVLTWSLIALALIDLDHQLLPDTITLPLLWLGLLVNTILPAGLCSPSDAVIGAALGYASLWSVYWTFKLLTGKEGMGYGDFKMLAALGAWMGWQSLPVIVILSSVVGAIVGISLQLSGRDRNIPFSFGPFLAGAACVAMFWGEALQPISLQWMI